MNENAHIDSFSAGSFRTVCSMLKDMYAKEDTHVSRVEIEQKERTTGEYYHVSVWYEEIE